MYNNEIPEKDIKRGKIVKYGLATLLGLTLVGCSGIDIYDVDVDHTKDVCFKTKLIDTLSPDSIGTISMGMETHQIPEIVDNLEEKGYKNIKISYQQIPAGYEVKEYANYDYESNTFTYQETLTLRK